MPWLLHNIAVKSPGHISKHEPHENQLAYTGDRNAVFF